MQHINKPKAVRTALCLDHTQAGRLIMGATNKKYANNLYRKMELDNETVEHLSNGTRMHLNLILLMIKWRDEQTDSCYLALDTWMNESDEDLVMDFGVKTDALDKTVWFDIPAGYALGYLGWYQRIYRLLLRLFRQTYDF